MKRRTRRVAFVVAPLVLSLLTFGLVSLVASAPPVDAASAGAETAGDLAVQYFDANQDSTGGWDSGSFGWPACSGLFNTYDTALTIAEANQSGATWSATEARAGITAVTNSGNDAFDAIDTALGNGSGCSTGKIAQLVILATATDDGTAAADPATWDPAGNGAPVNLVSLLGTGGGDGGFGSIYTTYLGVLARRLLGASMADVATSITYIRNNQNVDGGFGGFGSDTDTTSGTVMALAAGGVGAQDSTMTSALAYLRARYHSNGGFDPGYAPTLSANSTGLAMLAVSATGYDINSSCWLHPGQAPSSPDTYVTPETYLLGLQVASGGNAGRIAAPDDFGAVFATAQAVEGLLRRWLPVTIASGASTCPAAGASTSVAVNGGNATIATSTGTIQNVTVSAIPTTPTPPTNRLFPFGLISFNVVLSGAGQSTTVTLTFPGTVNDLWKLQNGAWKHVDAATFAGNQATFTLTDGGFGDADGVANGTIVDPVAGSVILSFTG